MLRSCYSTEVQVYRDDPRTVTFEWYFVPPANGALPYFTPFSSANWDTDQLGYSGLGEVWGAARPYRTGERVGNAVATNFCGSEDQWRNGQSVPPVIPTPVNTQLTPLCCHRPPEILSPADIKIRNACVLYWLATLLRCTYANDADLFRLATEAVLPPGTPTTLVPNTNASDPGWGLIRLPFGGIVIISGTTNGRQWADQIFLGLLLPTLFPTPTGPSPARALTTYRNAANTIDAAIDAFIDDGLPVLIVGHSLGGAVGETLAFKWSVGQRRPGSKCVSLGAPKPGDAALAAGVPVGPDEFLRLSTDLDFFPQAPPQVGSLPYALPAPLIPYIARYNDHVHPGAITVLLIDGSMTPGPQIDLSDWLWLALCAAAAGRPIPWGQYHFTETYVKWLRNGCPILPLPLVSGWTDPGMLDTINLYLDNAIAFGKGGDVDDGVGLVAGTVIAAGIGGDVDDGVGLVAGTVIAAGIGGDVDDGVGLVAGTSIAVGRSGDVDDGMGVAAGTPIATGIGGDVDDGVGLVAGNAEAVGLGGDVDDGVGLVTASSTATGLGGDVDDGIGLADIFAVGLGGDVDDGVGLVTANSTATGLGGDVDDGVGLVTASSTATGLGGDVDDGIGKASGGGDDMPTGAIIAYGAASAPTGWLLCDGSAVSRTTYATLFGVIGTTWGAGDGSTTFNLPDLRGRTGIGAGTGSGLSPRTLAATGGEESHVLTTGELASHTHTITDPGHVHTQTGGAQFMIANITNGVYGGGTRGDVATSTPSATTGITATNAAGSGTAHNTMQPFAVLSYIIQI